MHVPQHPMESAWKYDFILYVFDISRFLIPQKYYNYATPNRGRPFCPVQSRVVARWFARPSDVPATPRRLSDRRLGRLIRSRVIRAVFISFSLFCRFASPDTLDTWTEPLKFVIGWNSFGPRTTVADKTCGLFYWPDRYRTTETTTDRLFHRQPRCVGTVDRLCDVLFFIRLFRFPNRYFTNSLRRSELRKNCCWAKRNRSI